MLVRFPAVGSAVRVASCVVAVALACQQVARADEAQARAYLGAARDDIKSGNFDSVERTLELFGDQLEGVDAGVVATLKAEAESIKKEAADKKFAAQFDDAAKVLTTLEKDRDLARQMKAVQANPKDEDALAYFGGEVRDVKRFDDDVLAKLPAADARTKALRERYQKFAGPIFKISMAAERDKTLERVTTQWKQSSGEATAQFTDDPATSYADWLKGTSLAITSDRTRYLAEAAKRILDDADLKSFETAFADDTEAKAAFKPIHAAYDEGVPKLVKEIGARLDAMEKAAPDTNNFPRVSQATRALAELAPADAEAVALNGRADALFERWNKGAADADAAFQAKLDALEKSAEEAWPAIVAKYEGQTVGVDPATAAGEAKGKLVRFEGKANVAGTEFGAPDFCYVATVDGKPIAFKFTKRQLAIADSFRTFNGGRPISLTDFRDVVGRVVGSGKVNHLAYNNLREQYDVIGQVDVPVCELVAFKTRYVTVGEESANTDAVLK